jgi:hypothetical protein
MCVVLRRGEGRRDFVDQREDTHHHPRMSRSSARLATKQIIKREVIDPDEKTSSPKKSGGRTGKPSSWTQHVTSKEIFPDNFMEDDDAMDADDAVITRTESEADVKARCPVNPVQPLAPVSPVEKKKQRLLSTPTKSKNRHAIDPDLLPIPCSSRQSDDHHEEELMVIPEPQPLIIETKDDINLARKKLEGVLSKICKNNLESQQHLNENDYSGFEEFDGVRSRKHGMKGRGGKPSKKILDDDSADQEMKQPSLVLKLFDRSVDLAKFTSGKTTSNVEIPLYPVVREWMKNMKHGEYQDGSSDVLGEKRGLGIYHLPRPLPVSVGAVDPRIPKRDTTKLTVEEIDEQMKKTDFLPTTLFAQQLERWKQVRKDWKDAAQKNELRYKHSCDVLKAMFDKSNSGGSSHPSDALLEPKVEPNDSF